MNKKIILSLLPVSILFFSCGEKAKDRPVDTPAFPMEPFVRSTVVNPVITPDTTTLFLDPVLNDLVAWESSDTFNPAAAVLNDEIVVLYRAEDRSGEGIGQRTSRLGYASSKDGLHFTRLSTPVLYPGNDSQKEQEYPGGCEDPRVALSENGTYVMLYTQWNRQVPRLAVATSTDLKTWTKHGPAFGRAYNGRFFDHFSKSASIVTGLKSGRQVIVPVCGKYWMYWGEKAIHAATSENLIDWTPLLDDSGELKILYQPRKGYFDSELTECGPPAVMTKEGIILLYNGKNRAVEGGDPDYTPNSYCAGQALFDANHPDQLLKVADKPFLIPQESFEKSGQYPAGTVFVEGLVYFHDQWFLYYGCADSRVAVAIYDSSK